MHKVIASPHKRSGVQHKYNPFKPNEVVHAGMFVGRLEEVQAIERCLFQAKNGNPQHFLIQGERGIGKSSLLFYVEIVANGTIPYDGANRFRFLVAHTDLGACESDQDIIRKLGRALKSALSEQEKLRENAKEFWSWLTKWEVLGVQYHKDQEAADLEQAAEDLVDNLSSFCERVKYDLDGVLFLIDEADHPSSDAKLGAYLKLVTERLARKECRRVVFGLAGLPALLGRLRDSHESSLRLFQTFHLEPLALEERMRVVHLGIEEANQANKIQTQITIDAAAFLADLSEGYPHFVQQFSYSAFEHDIDNIIDVDDVGEAAYKDGGALSQLGHRFFNDMYHARISSEEYRRVLDSMAEHGDEWVVRKDIIKESGVSEANVTNALQSLKAKGVILQDETRRGFYRLPTNSFAAWINASKSARAQASPGGDIPF
jgi:biotin operon repressor